MIAAIKENLIDYIACALLFIFMIVMSIGEPCKARDSIFGYITGLLLVVFVIYASIVEHSVN